MIDQPPEALVRGCNDPISIGILSDWIEEQYGIVLDYNQSGWSEGIGYNHQNIYNYGDIYNEKNGDGYGYGDNCGSSFGNGFGIGIGWSNGNGYGYSVKTNGIGSGYFIVFLIEDRHIFYEFGYGINDGNGHGVGSGHGYSSI